MTCNSCSRISGFGVLEFDLFTATLGPTMFDSFGSAFNRKPPHKGGPMVPESASALSSGQKNPAERKLVYSKVFRWVPPDGQTQSPATVEVLGTFTHWQKVPLIHD